MKASELRLGNYVYVGYSSSIECLLGVISENANLTFNEGIYHGLLFNYPAPIGNRVIEIDNCEGIPITEEWLLKLGFVKSGDEHHISIDLIKDPVGYESNQIDIQIDLGISMITVEQTTVDSGDEGYFRGEIFPKFPVHIHQLQNLYFSLTGEELTIKQEGK